MSLQRMHGVSLFFFHTPSPSSPALNAPRLYGETHFARVGGKKRGGEKARCGRMLCKQRVQHAIPSPSPPPPCRKTGHRPFRGNNSSAGTFMRAGARLLLPLLCDFFRVAVPALDASMPRKMFYRADLSRFDEKRSSSTYFTPFSRRFFRGSTF